MQSTNFVVVLAFALASLSTPRSTRAQPFLDELCPPPEVDAASANPPEPILRHRAITSINAEGIEVVRRSTGVECTLEDDTECQVPSACESRQVEIRVRTDDFDRRFAMSRARIRMVLPGAARRALPEARVDQGGIRSLMQTTDQCRGRNASNCRSAVFDWNHRSVSDNENAPSTRRYSYYSDVARLVLEAPPRNEQFLARLRALGILSNTESLEDVRKRSEREDLIAGREVAQWISDLRNHVSQGRDRLARGVVAMYGDDALAATNALAEQVRAFLALVPQRTSDDTRDLWTPIENDVEPKLRAMQLMTLEARRESLREMVVTLLSLGTVVRRPPTLSAHADWEVLKGRICAVYTEHLHVGTYDLVENELFHEVSTNPARVLEFDRRMGYLARSDDRIAVSEGDQVFVRVHGVPAGEPVAVVWDETVVSTTRAERGLDGMPRDGAPPPADPAVANVLRAEPGPNVAHSSLVLRVGEVQSGRYRFSVCRSGSTPADCQRSGHHSLTVHGVRWWGFRAGFGMSTHWSPEVTAIRQGTGDIFLTRYRDREVDARFAIPFSAVVYPVEWWARQLQSNRFEAGLAVGFDLLNPTTDFHAGLHFGYGPLGLLVAASFSRSRVPNVTGGLLVEADSYPDLGGLFGRRRVLSRGLLVAVTFDFDVFRRIYEALLLKGLPAIGGGP